MSPTFAFFTFEPFFFRFTLRKGIIANNINILYNLVTLSTNNIYGRRLKISNKIGTEKTEMCLYDYV
jgi:hypothetical protein